MSRPIVSPRIREQRLIYVFDLFGTAVFAITGALAAGRKRMDFFGVMVVGLVTAVGGGTIRDLVLGLRPVFWVADVSYVTLGLAAAAVTFIGAPFLRLPRRAFVLPDAIGLAVFTIIGAGRTLDAGFPPLIAVVMGIITGVGGGMIRDVLCREMPLILSREIYATASLAGGVIFVALLEAGVAHSAAVVAAMLVILLLRLAALHWNLSLPTFRAADDEPD